MKVGKICIYLYLGLLLILFLLPVFTIITNGFMGEAEMKESYGSVLLGMDGELKWKLFPLYPTLRSYLELFFDSPGFFVMFWNSCKQVFPTIFGQLVIGMPAAWAFSQYSFAGKKILFDFYLILMVLPFQVTMVSDYLVLSRLHLLDTAFCVILPGVFSTFPVFLMTKFMKAVPKSLLEAARADGAGEFILFIKIGIPLAMPGMISTGVLEFLEYWNAIEAPVTFIKTEARQPLSLYLSNITNDRMSIAFAACTLTIIPAFLIFIWGQEYLEQGIAASGLKE